MEVGRAPSKMPFQGVFEVRRVLSLTSSDWLIDENG